MTTIGLILAGERAVPNMVHLARQAEALGYASVWVAETRFTRDAVTTAAAVAAATERIAVGTAVINPFTRGAVLTAVTAATLDELAGGRFVLGIGPGSPTVLAKQGIAWEEPLKRLRDHVVVVRRLLIGEPVTYEGSTLTVRGARLDFRPVRDRVPIYFGVTGPRALDLAGQIADGVILNGLVSLDYTRAAVERVRRAAEEAGRDPNAVAIAASLTVGIDRDAARARDALRPLVATYLAGFPNLARESGVAAPELAAIAEATASGGATAGAAHVSDATIDRLTCAGTVEEVRAAIAARRAAEVEHPLIGFASGDATAGLEALADS